MTIANYNWFDLLILGIFLFSILGGFSRGFIREVLSFVSWIAAFVVAVMFSSRLAVIFTHTTGIQSMVSSVTTDIGVDPSQQVSWLALGISFIILFITTLFIGNLLASLVGAIFAAGIGIINRLLGAIFGFARGFLINLMLIFLLQLIPQVPEQNWWQNSTMVHQFQPAVQWLDRIIQPGLEKLKSKVGGTLEGVTSTIQDTYNKATQ